MQGNSVLSQLQRNPRSSCFSNQGPASWKSRDFFRPWKDNNIICNPLVLKSSYFKCEKKQKNCEVWWLWTLTLQRYKGNEPFATDQPRDAKLPYWWANEALGYGKQSDQIWIFFPVWTAPRVSFALQLGDFCTLWSLICKGPIVAPEIGLRSCGIFEKQVPEHWRVLWIGYLVWLRVSWHFCWKVVNKKYWNNLFSFGLTVRLSTMNMGSLQTFMKQHIQVGFSSLAQVLSTSVPFFVILTWSIIQGYACWQVIKITNNLWIPIQGPFFFN